MLNSYFQIHGINGPLSCPSEFSAVCSFTGLVERDSYSVTAVHCGEVVKHKKIN